MRATLARFLAIGLGAAGSWLMQPNAGVAQRSYAVVLDQAQGLDVGEIAALAQDRTGFIWVGGNGGLLRYDGSRFVWWGDIHTLIREIETSHSGEIIAATESGTAYAVVSGGITPVQGPSGRAVSALQSAVFDEQDNLWAIIAGRLWMRSAHGGWKTVPPQRFDGETPQRLNRVRHGVGLVTNKSVWVLDGSTRPDARLMTAANLYAVTETSDGSYWIADHRGDGLWHTDRSGLTNVGRPSGRVMAMTAREGSLWLSIDRFLLSIDRRGQERVQGLKEGISSGGPLLVDRDGALWLGTFVGLLRFPEPDTLQWTEEDGLPSSHAHDLLHNGSDIWINTWQGSARLSEGNAIAKPRREIDADGIICADPNGGAWVASRGQVFHWRAGRYTATSQIPRSPNLEITGCVAAFEAETFLATTNGLYLVESTGAGARLITGGFHGRSGFGSLWPGESGDLWLADPAEACRFRIASLETGQAPAAKECERLPSSTAMSGGIHVAPGVEWLPVSSGLIEIKDGQARRLAGNAALPGASIQRLVPSRSGGYWAAGPGALLRMAPCTTCKAGWRLLEKPGAGQGIPGNSAVDVLETAEGDLWIAGNRGVFRIPAAARVQPAKPKTLVLVAATLDDRPVSRASIEVAPDRHRLELIFSALYFRDPARLLYRYRLSSGEAWSLPTSEPVLQLIDQRAGRYSAQMEASLDGRSWTSPAGVDFTVLPPLWRSPAALLAYVLLTVLLLALAYQLRVRHLLTLQRQRLSIARDLHDELGSSLGSIVALTGALSSPSMESSDRSRVAGQIAAAAQMAGAGLRSLVWTMRNESVDAVVLGREIAEQAQRLAPHPPPSLNLTLPSTADDTVFDAKLRRQVLMIVLEAIHNCVRHATARAITIALEARGTGWRLTVADDGRGFDPSASRLGTGLESMRWRAQRIGGLLLIESNPGHGTRIVVDFAAGNGKRPSAKWRARGRVRESGNA